jgi:hypothetical protein
MESPFSITEDIHVLPSCIPIPGYGILPANAFLLGGLWTLLEEAPQSELTDLQMLWTAVDAPWLHGVDRALFAKSLDRIRALSPAVILSSHLPPAFGMTEQFLKALESVVDHEPFTGPDQAALEQMLAQAADGSERDRAP